MELLVQKVTEAPASCKEDSKEMALGFKRDAKVPLHSPEIQGAQAEIERVCIGISPGLVCFFTQKEEKKNTTETGDGFVYW